MREQCETCMKCRFWYVCAFQDDKIPVLQSGNCYRYPPRINPSGIAHPSLLGGECACGEFKIKI